MTKKPERLGQLLRGVAAESAHWPRTVRLVWSAAPRLTLAWGLLLVAQGLLPAASVYLTKLVVDAFVLAFGSADPWSHSQWLGGLLVAMASVLLASEIVQSCTEWVRVAQAEKVHDTIKDLVHRQSAALDLSFYESAEYYDALHQAQSEAAGRPLALLENFGGLLQSSVTLVAMAAILVPYGLWVPVVLLVSTLPAFFVVLRSDRIYHRWWQKATAQRRWAQYYDAMLTAAEAASEVRIFGLGDTFRARYRELRRGLRDERLRQLRRQAIAKFGASVLALLVSAATMVWMVWRALDGRGTLGDLALFYQAFSRGQGLMRGLLGSIGQVLTNSLYLGNLYRFLELGRRVPDPETPRELPRRLERDIVLRDVSFTYPGSARPALEHFDISIPAGKVVAVVGPNGAGKTTMLKLICRFYDPEHGSVELDGVDVRDYRCEDVWRFVTVLFQSPVPYHATARECIALGDVGSPHSEGDVEAAARSAGAHDVIRRLPNGYDTLLGKWFADGVEVSGGERQRIALARAYLRRSPLILLDEPTSFMDSWSEADWFDRFRRVVEDRSAIIITHRFTIAMRADLIYVMDEGRIVESGTHLELLGRGGLYSESWRSQMAASEAAAAVQQGT